MGTHIEPPFMFRPVVVKGAVELEISCSRCDHGAHLSAGKSSGTIPLDRAEDLHAALGEALAEGRALEPSASAALDVEARKGLLPRPFDAGRMLPPELEAESMRAAGIPVPDRKTIAAEGDPSRGDEGDS